jgi:hypothetical protein
MGVNGQRTRWRLGECIAESDYQAEVAGYAEGEDFLDSRLQVVLCEFYVPTASLAALNELCRGDVLRGALILHVFHWGGDESLQNGM